MYALGQEAPTEEEALSHKMTAMQNVAQYRDQIFAGSQGQMIKVVGGTLIGMYVIYRFLFKR